MHFSHLDNGKASTLSKVAVVVVFHLVLGFALIKSINTRAIHMPKLVETILTLTPEMPPPPPPPESKPLPKLAPPEALRPKVEVPVPPPVEPEPTIQTAEITPDVAPAPPAPAAPAQESSTQGQANGIRTAVLAEGCATPAYPPSAARAGETGTVLLALLVGPDGRVTDSKVQKSSGSRALDKAAREALSLCKFKPATDGGAATSAWSQISYVWKLD